MTNSELVAITSNLTSRQAEKVVNSFKKDSELRECFELLKDIRFVGDSAALEIMVKLALYLCDDKNFNS